MATPDAAAERPRLAPATWLVGKLDESALEQPPWAVERAKLGYVQLGELAYHVAEQANGERSVEEIAQAVSAALERPVSVGDVRALIHTVLVPRGVVTVPNGHGPDEPLPCERPAPDPTPPNGHMRGPRHAAGPPSVRERVIGPLPLERISSVLMWLFWPPVMLVIVGVALAALTWLFVFHGLAASVVQVLSQPLLLPLALLLAVLLAGLEPIGPMVALYGAGARIERLRVTPSLRHPGVSLDVSDDYGLSRWARLTVDVGGAYLLLVAALLLCLLGMVTGAEFLFLTVALVTLNALRLLLPFGRPGADRLLADLLLVPEPLLYAGQALARLAPVGRASARRLPPLKRWGWLVIGLYLLATAIVLLVVGLVVLRATPVLMATLLAALVAHLSDMLGALGERDTVGFFGGLLQGGLLALMAFVLAVAAVAAAVKLLLAAWAWGQASSRHRLTVGSCAMVGALVILLFWLPVPRFGPAAGRVPRSLLGTTFRPLAPITRGTLADLFTSPAAEEAAGGPASVMNDISTGVNEPLPGQATPGSSSGGAAGAPGPR